MKITIAPSENDANGWSSSVETPHDDLTVSQVMELISRVMLSFGFADKNIEDFFKDIAENA